jgi:hypothetical protein
MVTGWKINLIDTDAAARELYGDQYHLVRYEALLDRPWEMIAALWHFLGAAPEGLQAAVEAEMDHNPDADWQHQKASELVANLEKGKRGSWRDLLTPRDKAIFKDIAGQTLIDWGYAQDLDW